MNAPPGQISTAGATFPHIASAEIFILLYLDGPHSILVSRLMNAPPGHTLLLRSKKDLSSSRYGEIFDTHLKKMKSHLLTVGLTLLASSHLGEAVYVVPAADGSGDWQGAFQKAKGAHQSVTKITKMLIRLL